MKLRQNKHDRLFQGHQVSAAELAVDHAVAPFDAMAKSMNKTWGEDRLVALVSPETAAKYGRTMGALNEAIDANDADRVADRAAACIRGMQAMEVEALRLGHTPPRSGVLVADVDGTVFGVLPDPDLWRIAEAEYPGLAIFTLREIGLLIKAAEDGHPMMSSFKDAFPGAEVISIRKPRGPVPDDEIPF